MNSGKIANPVDPVDQELLKVIRVENEFLRKKIWKRERGLKARIVKQLIRQKEKLRKFLKKHATIKKVLSVLGFEAVYKKAAYWIRRDEL